jgi:uncharacterized protein YcaQ
VGLSLVGVTVHQLSREDARRIAVRAQLLDAERPSDLVELIRQLTSVQYDQTAAVAPNADLIAWSRLGSAYDPAELVSALEEQTLIELQGMIRPVEDIALYRPEMEVWPGTGELREWMYELRDWVKANEACRLDILERLRQDGPLISRELPDLCNVPWRSSGWTNNQNVIKMLDFMVQRGEIAVAGRQGRDKLWDLASRIYPDDPPLDREHAVRTRNERRLKALGIARAQGPICGEPRNVGEAGEPAVIEGVRGTWHVDPDQLGRPFTGRTAILSPLDRLVYDRKRMVEIFEFDYQLEMYKPAAKRRWGFFALPILSGDRLVGKVDATADRKSGVLRVDAVHQDSKFTKTVAAAVDHELDDLARWLDLKLVRS